MLVSSSSQLYATKMAASGLINLDAAGIPKTTADKTVGALNLPLVQALGPVI